MSALGALVVKLALEYAEYTKGLDKGSQEALKFAQNTQRSFDKATASAKDYFVGLAKGALGAVVAYAGINSALTKFTASINEMDKINDLSQKLSIGTGTLQEFAYAGQLSGIAMEDMANGLKKLQVNMLESITGGKEQAAVFNAMGISVKDANGNLRSAESVMNDVADVFAGLESGATKTALAVKLFGKQGAEMVPFLNEGSDGIKKLTDEAHKFGAVLSDEAIKKAAEFNDNLDRLAALSKASFAALANEAVPALNQVMQAYLGAAKAQSGFMERLAITASISLGGSAGKQIGGAQEQLDALIQSRDAASKPRTFTMGSVETYNKRIDAQKRLISTLKEMQQIDALTGNPDENQDARDRRFDPRNGPSRAAAIANSLAESKEKKEKKEKISDYEKLTRKINEKIAADQKQLDIGRPLTDSEKEITKIVADRASGAIKLTDAEFGLLKVQIEKQSVLESVLSSRISAEQVEKERQQNAQKEIATAFESVEAMRTEIETYGMLPSAIAAVTLAKLEQRKASLELSGEALPSEIMQVNALIEANKRLRDLQGTKESMDAVKAGADEAIKKAKEAADETQKVWDNFSENVQRNLGDGLFNAMQGKFDGIGDSFLSMIQRMAADALAAKLSEKLFTGGSTGQGWIGAALSVFGAMSGSGGSEADLRGGGSMFANGAAFSNGKVTPFADGSAFTNGVVNSPTRFNIGEMGEAGPEAIMPLARGSDGSLGIKASGGGGRASVTFAPVYQIDSRTDRAQIMSDMQKLTQQANAELVDKLQRAGAI